MGTLNDDACLAQGGEGGGATTFTELADAPDVITPNAVVCGNADGSGLIGSPLLVVSDGSVFAAAAADTGTGGGAVNLFGGASSLASGEAGGVTVNGGNSSDPTGIGGNVQLAVGTGGAADGNILLTGIPTADPEVANAIWNDAGTLKISAG